MSVLCRTSKTKIAESNIDVLIPICVNEVAYVAEMERAENYYTKQHGCKRSIQST
jgi:hypothetical protein